MKPLSHAWRLGAAALLVIAFASAEADAGPGKGKNRGGNNHHGGSVAVKHHGGPPPWAPAHGYRRKHGHGHVDLFNFVDVGRAPAFCSAV